MASQSIRCIALCVLKKGQEILVQEGFDVIRQETFYRPPGGGIEFGEYSWDAVRREMKEELGVEVDDLEFLGTLESLFQYEGQPRHELVFLFGGDAEGEPALAKPEIQSRESDGSILRFKWMPLSSFSRGKAILYPEGLLDMLTSPVMAGIR